MNASCLSTPHRCLNLHKDVYDTFFRASNVSTCTRKGIDTDSAPAAFDWLRTSQIIVNFFVAEDVADKALHEDINAFVKRTITMTPLIFVIHLCVSKNKLSKTLRDAVSGLWNVRCAHVEDFLHEATVEKQRAFGSYNFVFPEVFVTMYCGLYTMRPGMESVFTLCLAHRSYGLYCLRDRYSV